MIRLLIFIIIIFMFSQSFQLNRIYTDIFYAGVFLVLGMVIGMIADYLRMPIQSNNQEINTRQRRGSIVGGVEYIRPRRGSIIG